MQQSSITAQELAKHNTAEDAWVAYRGTVYNITPWIPRHPGGKSILDQIYGKEISDLFDSYHFASANAVLGTAKVPAVGKYAPAADDEVPTYATTSPFYDELRSKVKNYIKENDLGERRMTPIRILDSVIIIGVILVFLYFALFKASLAIPLRFLSAIVVGVFSHLYLTHIAHDVAHVSYSNNQSLWSKMTILTDIISGHSLLMWVYRHNLGHHIYTNVSAADPDISKYTIAGGDTVLYYSPFTKVPGYVRPFIYLMTTAFMKIEDMLSAIEGKFGIVKINKMETHEILTLWGGKFLFVFSRTVLPKILLQQSWFLSIALFLTIEAASGLVFGVMSQMNHVTLDREWPENHSNKDWAKLQVLTCINYCNDSYFWTYMSGHLNYQVEHHLFPALNPRLYPLIAPIVRDVCKAHNVEYTHKTSGIQAIKDHFAQLELFSQKLPKA